MKQVFEWDEDYLLNLTPGEFDWLEIKDSRKLDFTLPNGNNINEVTNELSKQLSAFANSGGGTLVYGLFDTPINTPRKVDQFGGVSLTIKNNTKEWLEDTIPGLIDHQLTTFNVYVITNLNNPNSQILDGKGIFLIDIPSSEQAPHQARDNKYYARVGGKSRPIGHQIVSDIFGRAKYPKMKLFCHIISKDNSYNEATTFSFFCKNIGKIYAKYVNGFIRVPAHLFGDKLQFTRDRNSMRQFEIENMMPDAVGRNSIGVVERHKTQRYKPVLPGLGFSIDVPFALNRFELEKFSDEIIYWSIYADNAPIVSEKITIGEILQDKMLPD